MVSGNVFAAKALIGDVMSQKTQSLIALAADQAADFKPRVAGC